MRHSGLDGLRSWVVGLFAFEFAAALIALRKSVATQDFAFTPNLARERSPALGGALKRWWLENSYANEKK